MAETPEQARERIAAEHTKLQDLLVMCEDCGRYTRNLADHRSRVCKGKADVAITDSTGSDDHPSEAQHGSSAQAE